MGNRLRDSGLAERPYEPSRYPSASRDWAYDSFLSWSVALSAHEVEALRSIGTADYRSIQSYARGAPDPWTSDRDAQTIASADTAIAKGRVDRDLTLFRTNSSTQLNEVWETLAADESAKATFTEDGYAFTSLDRSIAERWLKNECNGRGIVMEIETPAGTNAAFMESEPILDSLRGRRDFLELVLPRGMVCDLSDARIDADGRRTIRAKVTGFAPKVLDGSAV